MLRRQWTWGRAIAIAACSWACGGSGGEEPIDTAMPAPPSTGVADPSADSSRAADPSADGNPVSAPEASGSGVDFGVSDAPTTEVEVVCAAQSAGSELRQVSLAFLFDVSGSMGSNNRMRFDTKWVPVVAATEAFFAEADAAALSASLTFFPRPEAATRCTAEAYSVPDVPETPLPSPLFAEAIRGLDYRFGSNNWRSSTPTLPAYSGLAASLVGAPSNALRAIVMVTDGVPEQCQGANDIQLVADAVRNSGIQTFVIGVANPPGDEVPNNLPNLDLVAQAGGTEHAFIISTGNPAQTQAEFKAVIDDIRGISLACNMQIPLPPVGSVFVPEQVNVIYGSGTADEVRLSYDPECAVPDAWRYDDADDPSSIILCRESCDRAQREVSASLKVEFGCERQGVPR
jgi:hypothetical protein